ncbi:MAG TPA: hypothetical protein VG713_22550 [Pirellulales bacterium]|nr:hypothetical protein [Pirellulales bacterium]
MRRHANRREFLGEVGRGMLVASVGYGVAVDMGLTPVWAAEASDAGRLDFGPLEPLVTLLEETPQDRVLPVVVERIKKGADLKTLVAAAALANARALGGENYVGFHTMMALEPALLMAQELPAERAALPVLKVLYRNAGLMPGRDHDTLHAVAPAALSADQTARALREAVHRGDKATAEQALAAAAARSADDAFNDLLETVEEGADVHRVVLAHRAWDMLKLCGYEHADTLLRQSVRFCVNHDDLRKHVGDLPKLLPKLFDAHKLAGRTAGDRRADDAWIAALSATIFAGTPEQAADAVAAALAEGFAGASISEAVSLAANQLLLRDSGRTETSQRPPEKPLGSVHGDSIGVHACDSANAWRHIAEASNVRNSMAALILSAYQVAFDRRDRGGDFLRWQPRPTAEQLERITTTDPAMLLDELDEAIRGQEQERACALVARYGNVAGDARPVCDLLLRYAVSEDGSLHAEKFYRTATNEFALARPAFRWRQLVALARVTASEYGRPAPGYAQACELLRIA